MTIKTLIYFKIDFLVRERFVVDDAGFGGRHLVGELKVNYFKFI